MLSRKLRLVIMSRIRVGVSARQHDFFLPCRLSLGVLVAVVALSRSRSGKFSTLICICNLPHEFTQTVHNPQSHINGLQQCCQGSPELAEAIGSSHCATTHI